MGELAEAQIQSLMFPNYNKIRRNRAMSDKPFFDVFTTPVGELVFPWVTKADTRYDPDGLFQTKLKMPFENAQELIARLDAAVADHRGTLDAAKQEQYNTNPVYEEEVDEDGTKTGNVLFRFKLKARVHKKDDTYFDQAPVIVMAEDGVKVERPVYGGTMAKIKGQIIPYTVAASKVVGVTLRMRSVQVHELVSGDSTGGGAFWTEFE